MEERRVSTCIDFLWTVVYVRLTMGVINILISQYLNIYIENKIINYITLCLFIIYLSHLLLKKT